MTNLHKPLQGDTPSVDAIKAKWPRGADFEERERDLEELAQRLEIACRRALAIEQSVTQGQERELRFGYVELLQCALKEPA